MKSPPSGLAAVYVHGGAWRVGDKDLGTRTFFRRLAAQGHVVLDVAYTLWPKADIPTMVGEVKQVKAFDRELVLYRTRAGNVALQDAFCPHLGAHLGYGIHENTGRGGGIGLGIIAAILIVVWALSGFYKVDDAERGVVLQFGSFHSITMPGLHWHIPRPIQHVEKVNVSSV